MNEVRTTFRRMAFYYLLLALNILPNANVIPDAFPTRNLSAIYLLTLSVCLILYYSHRVTGAGGLSVMTRLISWMCMLLILLRGIKYSAFAGVGFLARHTWYFYYVPLLLIPLFLFNISLLVSSKKNFRVPKGWYLALALTVLFILLILTNDSHQLIFRFKSGFSDWDGDYSYGPLFYAITVWRYALYLASAVILIIKCSISSSKKNAWIILIPFSIGTAMNILLITGKMPKINGTNIIELPETLVFTVAIALECSIQLGLIPTNTDYGKLFRRFSISAQITDKKGKPVYASSSTVPLTDEQISMPSGSRIGEHTVLHRMKIPGGFGFWQDDMTELDRLNEELAEAKEELSQEAELIRLRGDLKEKQTKIEQRTLVFDAIAKRTQRQSQLISRLAKTARLSDDARLRERCRGKITLLGAYIKRYANLMLLSQESGVIEAGELALSVSEVLRYLNFCGIPGELVCGADCALPADAALAVFETFEALLEEDSMRGVLVNLSEQKDTVCFKLTLENYTGALPDGARKRFDALGVKTEMIIEDEAAYVRFELRIED